MFNPYNKESQPFDWAWQNQKMWADAFAPIQELLKPQPPKEQPSPPMFPAPFPSPSAPVQQPRVPLMTREEVRALLAAPLPAPSCTAAPVHKARADADAQDARTLRVCVRIAVVTFFATLLYLQLRGG